ncbi:RICIN domain-containing protein [Streptomyces venezuelae]|uniref:RICIN domain-containing protein n=1 Tax=Streptomyces venezuelae TaxID=54571 RepID=UPI001CC23EC7|nr:RICIN domain-containing protein [Streptomyces venezuelae]
MEGIFLLRNAASGLVLETEGSRTGSGTRVRVGPEGPPAAAGAQRWRIVPVHPGAATYHVVNVLSEKRLDVAGASVESGARIQLWKPNGFGAQEWLVEEHLRHGAATGVVSLIACISGLPLDVDPAGYARQWEETDAATQGWRLEPATAG